MTQQYTGKLTFGAMPQQDTQNAATHQQTAEQQQTHCSATNVDAYMAVVDQLATQGVMPAPCSYHAALLNCTSTYVGDNLTPMDKFLSGQYQVPEYTTNNNTNPLTTPCSCIEEVMLMMPIEDNVGQSKRAKKDAGRQQKKTRTKNGRA